MIARRVLVALAAVAAAYAPPGGTARAEGAPDGRPATLDQWLARQDAQVASGNESVALAEARERAEREKDSAEARYLYGRVLGTVSDRLFARQDERWREHLERARTQFAGALELDVAYAPAWRGLAKVHRRTKEHETALREARRAHGLDPASREGFVLLVTCLYEAGQRSEAYALLDEEIRRVPDDTSVRFLLASLMTAEGKTSQAEAELRVVLAQDPGHVDAHGLLVQILAMTNRPVEAVAAARRAVAAVPAAVELHRLLVGVLLRAGDRAGALQAMEAMLALDLPPDLRRDLERDLESLRNAPDADDADRPPTVDELVAALASPDVLRRRRAMEILLGHEFDGPTPREVASAVLDRDETVRVYAVQFLTKHGGPAAAGIMECLLFHPRDRDPSPRVRAFATRALGTLRATASLPVLMKALDESDPESVRAAICGIADVTGKRFVEDPEAPVPEARREEVRRAYREWWASPSGTWWKKRTAAAVAETGARRLARYCLPWLEHDDASLRAAVLAMLADMSRDASWKGLPLGTVEERKAAMERASTWLDGAR